MEIEKSNEVFNYLIPEFENYSFNIKELKVKSMASGKEIKLVSNLKVKKYKLYKNGNAYYVEKIKIIKSIIIKYFLT